MPKTTSEQHDWSLFITACGDIVRNWAQLEFYLIQHLGALLQCDLWRARIVWATMSNIRGRFILLARLADTYLDVHERAAFHTLLKRARKLGGKRNLIAHSSWANQSGKQFTFYEDTDPVNDDEPFQFGKERTYQLTNIVNWATDIQVLTNDFADWLKGVDAYISASPRIPPEQPESLAPRSDPPLPAETREGR